MVLRMRDEDRGAVELFRRKVPDLTSLGNFVRAGDGSPATGSALAADDLFWPHHPTSQVTWMAMVAASDHLDALALMIEVAEERRFLTAPFSLARGALVGAAQALWIVGEDDATTRQQRALSIAIEGMSQRIGYQAEQLKICSEEQRALSQLQLDEVLHPLLREAQSNSRRGYGFTDTEVIKQASRNRFAGEPNVEAAVITANLHWRRMGGDAHALGWQLMLGNVEWARDGDPEALSQATATSDIDAVVQATLWAATLLRRAADRFVVLATAPPPSDMDGAGGPDAEPA
jgi:hypothetical protein